MQIHNLEMFALLSQLPMSHFFQLSANYNKDIYRLMPIRKVPGKFLESHLNLSCGFLRRPQKFGAIFLKVWTLLSNVQTLRTMVPSFCGLLKINQLNTPANLRAML